MPLNEMTIKRTLPCCGVVLTNTARAKSLNKGCEEVLDFWVVRSTERHRCELVSEDNPFGFIRNPQGANNAD